MPTRPTWSGSIQISLVSIAVRIFPATNPGRQVELGKIIYYTHIKEFTVPKNYYFIASKGVGLKLQKLLANPDKLKKA